MKKLTILVLAFMALMTGCNSKPNGADKPQEDLAAKKMLQGIWADEDAQNIAFRARVTHYSTLTQQVCLCISKSLETRSYSMVQTW